MLQVVSEALADEAFCIDRGGLAIFPPAGAEVAPSDVVPALAQWVGDCDLFEWVDGATLRDAQQNLIAGGTELAWNDDIAELRPAEPLRVGESYFIRLQYADDIAARFEIAAEPAEEVAPPKIEGLAAPYEDRGIWVVSWTAEEFESGTGMLLVRNSVGNLVGAASDSASGSFGWVPFSGDEEVCVTPSFRDAAGRTSEGEKACVELGSRPICGTETAMPGVGVLIALARLHAAGACATNRARPPGGGRESEVRVNFGQKGRPPWGPRRQQDAGA